jgi:4-amino-4-deoxy-L-arabinose transferase-like glycosyltransferase
MAMAAVSDERPPIAWRPVLTVASVRLLLPLLSTIFVPLGYSADELYYLACADHLDWGYVDHPPLSVALLAASRALLGDSLLAIRLLPSLCEAAAPIVTAALAPELGGGGRAQLLSALAVAVAPIGLAVGFGYSMNPIEHLLWPLAALCLARLQNGGDPRIWLLLGGLLGLGLLNKLSTLWFGLGLAVGLVASPARRWLVTPWPWIAATLAAVLFAPHVIWQVSNDWPTVEFVRNNATGRVGADAAIVMHSPLAFAASQLVFMGPLAAPLWLAGLASFFLSARFKAHRALPWTFVAVFGLLAVSGRGTIYYLTGAFPMLFAAGGVVVERFATGRRRRLATAAALALVLQGVVLLPVCLPLASPERYLAIAGRVRSALGADPQASLPPFYEYMLGWPELTTAVAEVAAGLSDSERPRAGVLAGTFGEAGALVRFGPAAGLPAVIGVHNNFWLWGPSGLDGEVLIVVAPADSPILGHFERCELIRRVRCSHCEERRRDGPIFVCRSPRRPLPDLWLRLKDFV